MASTFVPSTAVDMNKEKDWASSLGMLDWDDTQIVFSKRSLLEFLKYAGITVDPNFSKIQKLPRYAKFGKLTHGATLDAAAEVAAASEAGTATTASTQEAFRPSRRVRTAPGGAHTNIFGSVDDDDDALATAPPLPAAASQPLASATTTAEAPTPAAVTAVAEASPRSRRLGSGVAGLWDAPNEDEFKPTRRVRERPGGKDSIADLF